MWRFNLTSNLWTWFAGSSTTNTVANFGTKGIAAPTNLPGSRYYSTMVADTNGLIYIFGGFGYDTTTAGKSTACS